MKTSAHLTQVQIVLPRLPDDDAHGYGQGDPELAWANRLIGAIGPGPVQDIGATQTLLAPERELDAILLRLKLRDANTVTEGGILVDRRFRDDDLPDPDYFRYEALEVVEIALAGTTVEEIEGIISALPFREYRVTWAEGEADDGLVRARV